MTHPTLKLSGLGYRELGMAAEFLAKLSDGTQNVETSSEDPMDYDDLSLGYNPNSDNLYLYSEDSGLTWMLNLDGKIEEWIICTDCGNEDWHTNFLDSTIERKACCKELDLGI